MLQCYNFNKKSEQINIFQSKNKNQIIKKQSRHRKKHWRRRIKTKNKEKNC